MTKTSTSSPSCIDACKPTFTISIPTFNRGEILRNTLAQVCTLADIHQQQTGERIEVLCVDNASTDNTGEVCAYYQSKYDFFGYLRNQQNIGLIQNIRKAIVSANADYVWTLSDDDYPAPWCMTLISRTLSFAKDNNIQHAFQLYSMAYADPSFRLGSHRSKKKPIQIFNPGCSILGNESIHGIALISRWIYAKRYWDDAYFDEIYRDTDIYTFINVMIRASLRMPALIISSPIAIASDRGSRSYYYYRTGIARVIEFPEIENLILTTHGVKKGRKMLAAERKDWFRDRLQFFLKLNLLRDQYPDQQYILAHPITSFKAERLLMYLVRMLVDLPGINGWLHSRYLLHKAQQNQ